MCSDDQKVCFVCFNEVLVGRELTRSTGGGGHLLEMQSTILLKSMFFIGILEAHLSKNRIIK